MLPSTEQSPGSCFSRSLSHDSLALILELPNRSWGAQTNLWAAGNLSGGFYEREEWAGFGGTNRNIGHSTIPQVTIHCKEMPNWFRRDPERAPHPHPRLWHENCPRTGSLGSLLEPGGWIVPLSPGRERKRIFSGEVVFGPGAAPSWGCSVPLRRGRTLLLEVSGPQPGLASLQMTGSAVGGGVKRPFPLSSCSVLGTKERALGSRSLRGGVTPAGFTRDFRSPLGNY